jgi:hypothetical protein
MFVFEDMEYITRCFIKKGEKKQFHTTWNELTATKKKDVDVAGSELGVFLGIHVNTNDFGKMSMILAK